jgi:hypothetical protein
VDKIQMPLGRSFGCVLFSSFIFVAAIVCTLVFFMEPRWETNDDVGMSMVAHGYGMASVGSPRLIFSNVLWGWLVRLIPNIGGVVGYSIATLATITVVGSVLLAAVVKSGRGVAIAAGLMFLLLPRAILFPQFTVNAGLLAVAAIACWHVASKQKNLLAAALGCVLFFLGYLIRSHEVVLVVLVAAPLFPWRQMIASRPISYGLLCVAGSLAAASFYDYTAYQGQEWKRFNELNLARAPYTDFNIVERLTQRPDILSRYDYSVNDVGLIQSWFFADPVIADPAKLKAMAADLGAIPGKEAALEGGLASVIALLHPSLIYVLGAALLVGLYRRNWRVGICWLFFLSIAFVLGVLGRPGTLRIYVPVAFLLLLAPLLVAGRRFENTHRALGLILCALGLMNFYSVLSESMQERKKSFALRADFVDFPTYPVVAWGAALPYEAIFPVLGDINQMSKKKIYALGAFTWAPFSLAYTEQQVGRGFQTLFSRGEGVPVIGVLPLLGVYCKERMNGNLTMRPLRSFGSSELTMLKCNDARQLAVAH